ncbi:Conserved protein of unknown function [Magnetospirillum sp. XM-1]|uniref:PAS domain S-box protein n=1 Tax=Magnetospirillum sp. XM-1 TaxID=1663591 RepID=UPI00073E07D2|nr:PAS domain S-box protein [Magnetospirillum sp. XM-1]CUW38659.1 Conserved protein of unknown function [Magnetospirillum sp. XM-1]
MTAPSDTASLAALESAEPPCLATIPPEPGERRIALAVLAAAAAGFLAAAPFAKVQWPQYWAFLPLYQSAYIVISLITAVLLLGQFRLLRSRALLVLAGAYFFDVLMAIAHALSFPGLFAPTGLLGAGVQTTAWLYFLWHGGFPLGIAAYALLRGGRHDALPPTANISTAIGTMALTTSALAGGLTLLATAGHDWLPRIMVGDLDASNKQVVANLTWLLSLAAATALWRRRLGTLLDLWLTVTVCIWIFDSALAAVLNHSRFDIGWYLGRAEGLVAGSLVFFMLLQENGALYARLAQLRLAENRENRERLADSEERFRRLFDDAPAAFRLTAPDGRILAHNRRFEMLFGYTSAEIPTIEAWWSLAYPDPAYRSKVIARWDAALHASAETNGSIEIGEFRVVCKDGGERLVEINGIMVPEGVLTGFLDITARHRAEQVTRLLLNQQKAARLATLNQLDDVNAARRSAERMAAALQESQERLQLLVDHAPAALAMFDRDMRYIAVSHRWLSDYGLGDREVLGHSHYEIFPDTPDRWKEIYRRGLFGEVASAAEDRFERDDGSVLWLHWELRPWRTTGGDVGGIVIFSEDITRRKIAEDALRTALDEQRHAQLAALSLMEDAQAERARAESALETVRKLSLAVEQSPDSIVITDLDGTIEYVNDAFLIISGYTRDEVIGQNPRLLQSGKTAPENFAALWQALRRGETWKGEFHNRRKDGEEYIEFAVVTPIRQPDGTMTHYVAVKEDITERKRLEAEIQQHRHHLEQLVDERTAELKSAYGKLQDIEFAMDSVGIGVHWIDCETGRFLYSNEAAAKMLGYSVEEINRLGVPDVTPSVPMEEFRRINERIRRQGSLRFETERATRDGRSIPVEVTAYYFAGMSGGSGKVIAFVTDISARREAQRKLEEAKAAAEAATRAKSSFLANMSHEIRTPLNAVLGLAQLGMRDSHGRKNWQQFERIMESGKGLLTVLDDILDISKLEAGRLTIESIPMVLGEVIDRSVQLVALRGDAKHQSFTVEEAPDLPESCLGDPARLQQVLVNLLSNATKFTPDGGAIALSVSRQADQLVFDIGDTGIGIAAEAADRLFLPFEQADLSTTRRFGGTGLGLAISRQLVEMMGGSVAVRSVVGQGSTFTVRLPIHDATAREPRPLPDLLLLGLPAAESAIVARAFPHCRVETKLDHVSADDCLVVVDRAVLDDPRSGDQAQAILARGGRLVAVVPPAHGPLPARFVNHVAVTERPVRTRHLLAVLAQPEPAASVHRTDKRLSGLRVLVAEDNEINRLVVDDMLTGEGAGVTLCENGRLALDEVLRQGEAAFDLVLTDVQMPEMDGYGLARAMAAAAPSLPVIGLTAHAMIEERTRCLEAGMVEHVAKPVELEDLIAVVLRHATPPEDSPPPPAFDWSKLEARYGGRKDFVRKLVETVLSAHGDLPDKLRRAAVNGDLPELAMLAHTVKGTAGNLGADRLREKAAATEHAARENDAGAATFAQTLADSFATLLDSLADRLNGE